jgi:hypothetical protein
VLTDVIIAIAAWVALSFLVTGVYAFAMGRRRDRRAAAQRSTDRLAVAAMSGLVVPGEFVSGEGDAA